MIISETMIKTLKIIKFIPIINLISFYLLAIPIPLIYKFTRKDYFNGFIKMLIGFIVYVIIFSVLTFSNEVINFMVNIILLYFLGIYFTFISLQCISFVQREKCKE